MKVLRGLYVTICYILALPLAMVVAMAMLLVGITHLATTLKAIVEGIKMGHNQNVQFIKYGRTV